MVMDSEDNSHSDDDLAERCWVFAADLDQQFQHHVDRLNKLKIDAKKERELRALEQSYPAISRRAARTNKKKQQQEEKQDAQALSKPTHARPTGYSLSNAGLNIDMKFVSLSRSAEAGAIRNGEPLKKSSMRHRIELPTHDEIAKRNKQRGAVLRLYMMKRKRLLDATDWDTKGGYLGKPPNHEKSEHDKHHQMPRMVEKTAEQILEKQLRSRSPDIRIAAKLSQLKRQQGL